MERTRIAVVSASGLIGSALVRSLTADGHEVVRLVRHAPRSEAEVRWDPERGRVDAAGLAGCSAVVNLAGAGVGDHRWTDAYKRRIHDSRVHGTAALAKAVAALDERPRVFVNGSAMGYYGETGERVVDENAPMRPRFPAGAVRGVGGGGGTGAGGRGAHGVHPDRAGRGARRRRLGAAVPAVPGGARGADGRRAAVLVVHRAARRGGGDPASPGPRRSVGAVQSDGARAADEP